MAIETPRLRPVEVFPVRAGGRQLVALRDPSGLAARIVTVSCDLAVLLGRFDGRHTLLDLQAEYMRAFGQLLPRAELESAVELLDREHFLDSPAFAAHKAALTEAFRAAPHRPAAHAGVSYPDDPDLLAARLEAFEREADEADRGTAGDQAAGGAGRLEAIVAPHIDLRVGGATYVPAYRALAAAGGADLAVILGVGHTGVPGFFTVSTKDFATPLGLARTDCDFVAALSAAFGEDLTAEELLHRADHTIEFQVLFLQRTLGASCRIVPVLCAFGCAQVLEADGPDAARIGRFAAALAETVAARRARGERVVLVVSADLAHVGPRYGDPAPFDPFALLAVERADRETLAAVCAGDAAGFLARVAVDEHARRICGFSPLYTALLAAGGCRGRLLAYAQGVSDAVGSVVSYASLALYR